MKSIILTTMTILMFSWAAHGTFMKRADDPKVQDHSEFDCPHKAAIARSAKTNPKVASVTTYSTSNNQKATQ